MEEAGNSESDSVHLPEMQHASAWRRFWSRRVDLIIEIFVLSIASVLIFPHFFSALADDFGTWIMLEIALLPIAFLLDAVCLATFGNTVGRKLAGVRVVRVDGARVSLNTALQRNLRVYLMGCGLGLPFVSMITMIHSHSTVSQGKKAAWDLACETEVKLVHPEGWRTWLLAMIVLVATFGGYML
jgi:uncharacterized RDD family membrane protein YckC